MKMSVSTSNMSLKTKKITRDTNVMITMTPLKMMVAAVTGAAVVVCADAEEKAVAHALNRIAAKVDAMTVVAINATVSLVAFTT